MGFKQEIGELDISGAGNVAACLCFMAY